MEKFEDNREKFKERALDKHKFMSELYKKNRFMFEIEVKKEIEALIKSAPEELQPMLKETQEYWNSKMKGAGSKHNRLVLAEQILMDQFVNVFQPAVKNAETALNEATIKH